MTATTLNGLNERGRELFPGILASLIVAAAATFLSEHYGAPVMLFALLVGMAMNFLSAEGAAELGELLDAAEKVTDRGRAQSPTLTVIKRQKEESVGKLSEMRGKVSGC